MAKYYIIGMGDVQNTIMEVFHEVINKEIINAEFFNPYIFDHKLKRLAYKIRHHKKLRKYLKFIPLSVWNKNYILERISIAPNENNYIIITPGTDVNRLLNRRYLQKFKETHSPNTKLILLLFDPVDSPLNSNGWNNVTSYFELFDMVATFDRSDADKYQLFYFMDPYSKREIAQYDNSKSDIYFVGHDKGRMNLLVNIAKYLNKNDVSCRFLVANMYENTQELPKGIHNLKQRISYNTMLAQIQNANCLLEVLCEGQSSASLRYYEAVVYDKKLLTNNKDIFNLPYYNENNMRYFNQVEDIDISWLKNDTPIHNNYKGDFSICNLFQKINEYFEG